MRMLLEGKAADNEKLYNYLMNLWNGPSFGHANSEYEHYKKSTLEHIQVLEAIQNQDSDTAREIMRGHIFRSMDNILANLPST